MYTRSCVSTYLMRLGFSPKRPAFIYLTYMLEKYIQNESPTCPSTKYFISLAAHKYNITTDAMTKKLSAAALNAWQRNTHLAREVFFIQENDHRYPSFDDLFAYMTFYLNYVYMDTYLSSLTACNEHLS